MFGRQLPGDRRSALHQQLDRSVILKGTAAHRAAVRLFGALSPDQLPSEPSNQADQMTHANGMSAAMSTHAIMRRDPAG